MAPDIIYLAAPHTSRWRYWPQSSSSATAPIDSCLYIGAAARLSSDVSVFVTITVVFVTVFVTIDDFALVTVVSCIDDIITLVVVDALRSASCAVLCARTPAGCTAPRCLRSSLPSSSRRYRKSPSRERRSPLARVGHLRVLSA